jgi:hypothetical protein
MQCTPLCKKLHTCLPYQISILQCFQAVRHESPGRFPLSVIFLFLISLECIFILHKCTGVECGDDIDAFESDASVVAFAEVRACLCVRLHVHMYLCTCVCVFKCTLMGVYVHVRTHTCARLLLLLRLLLILLPPLGLSSLFSYATPPFFSS